MKYTKEFPPKRGDRVILYNSSSIYRILSVGEDYISIKKLHNNYFQSILIENISFIKPCPWWLPWQK